MSTFDLIAFDGDDTLWHNERSYREGRERFRQVLASAGVVRTEDEIEERVNATEIHNIRYYGYGVSSFVLSLIETAIDLTGGRISGSELRELIALAKEMLTEQVELFRGASEAVRALAASHRLVLITKGDLLHQTSKADRSGLRGCFRAIEVVSHKTREVYEEILERHAVAPERFLMIGNSPRSDILPVLEAGGWAVYVPAELSWAHEHADVPEESRGRFFEIGSLEELPGLVERIAEDPGVRSQDSAKA
jgi:putative hydrolase of the HAD superfamily